MPHKIRLLPPISEAFENTFTPADLIRLTAEHFDFNAKLFVPVGIGADVREFFFNVVDALNKRDKLSLLLLAARSERPDNADLVAAAELLELSPTSRVIRSEPTPDEPAGNLEKAVRDTAQHLDVMVFREQIGLCEGRTCSIRANGQALGTGFLIGPDEILTNFHVAEPIRSGNVSPSAITIHFDFKRDIAGKVFEGPVVLLASDWLIARRPYASFDVRRPPQPDPDQTELDYAVLRLAKPVGDEPLAKGGQVRGWFDLAQTAAPPARDEPLFLLSHPGSAPLTISMGRVLDHVGLGRRMRHDAWSLAGSSGSPILDANGQLCGLHHGTEPGSGVKALFNQGIPIRMIAADMPLARALP